MKSFWRFEEKKISKPVNRLVLLQQICLVQSDLHLLVSEPKWSPKFVDAGGSCCIWIWTWCYFKLGRSATFDPGRQREFYHHLLQPTCCSNTVVIVEEDDSCFLESRKTQTCRSRGRIVEWVSVFCLERAEALSKI